MQLFCQHISNREPVKVFLIDNWSNIIQYFIRKVPSLEDSYLEGF